MKLIALDLDDTLYPERDYVASGHRAVAEAFHADTGITMADSPDLFDRIIARGIEGWDIDRILAVYRNHRPALKPDYELIALLNSLRGAGNKVVIITDGQSGRQRAKIAALGLTDAVDGIFVSEEAGGDKLTGAGFRAARRQFPCAQRIYIADNPAKDFIRPNLYGWQTVMLLDTTSANIHPQTAPTPTHQAHTSIFSLKDFLSHL